MSLINTQVQPFKTQAFHNGKFVEVSDQSLKGQWSVLIFMPGIIPTISPSSTPSAVATRLPGSVALASPATMSGLT